MLVSDVVNAVNIKVDNSVSARFTEAEIISTVNECLLELAIDTNLYNKTVDISVAVGQDTHVLPTDLSDIMYAYFEGNAVQILTSIEMYAIAPGWRNSTDSISISHVIYNEEDTTFITYPKLLEIKDLTIIGTGIPTIVSALTDTINLKSTYKNIIVYYIAGILLSNTGRTEDINRGVGYLNMYNQKLKTASSNITGSLYSGISNYNTPFS